MTDYILYIYVIQGIIVEDAVKIFSLLDVLPFYHHMIGIAATGRYSTTSTRYQVPHL